MFGLINFLLNLLNCTFFVPFFPLVKVSMFHNGTLLFQKKKKKQKPTSFIQFKSNILTDKYDIVKRICYIMYPTSVRLLPIWLLDDQALSVGVKQLNSHVLLMIVQLFFNQNYCFTNLLCIKFWRRLKEI